MKRQFLAILALILSSFLLSSCAHRYQQRGHDVDPKITTIVVENKSDVTVFIALGYVGDWIGGLDFIELSSDSSLSWSTSVLKEKRRDRSVIFIRWWEEDFSRWSREITVPVERATRYSYVKPIVIDNALIFGKTMQTCVIMNDTDLKLKITTDQGHHFSLAPNTYHVLELMPIRTVVSWRSETWPLNWPKKHIVFTPDQCPSVFFNGKWYGARVRITDPGQHY